MNNWKDTGKEAQPDKKNRVALGSAIHTQPGVRYKVMKNREGQILLDPVKTVPAYEAWMHEDPKMVEAFKRSVAEAEQHKLVDIDLSKYEDEED